MAKDKHTHTPTTPPYKAFSVFHPPTANVTGNTSLVCKNNHESWWRMSMNVPAHHVESHPINLSCVCVWDLRAYVSQKATVGTYGTTYLDANDERPSNSISNSSENLVRSTRYCRTGGLEDCSSEYFGPSCTTGTGTCSSTRKDQEFKPLSWMDRGSIALSDYCRLAIVWAILCHLDLSCWCMIDTIAVARGRPCAWPWFTSN